MLQSNEIITFGDIFSTWKKLLTLLLDRIQVYKLIANCMKSESLVVAREVK